MALPVAKLTIVIGAGVIVSALANEGRTLDILPKAFKFVFKQFERGDSRPTNGKPHNDTLLAQVNSLREELLQLSYNKPITIITTGRSGAGTYGIPVILVVVVGYGFIWWKGWKLSDFMFVTRRGFSDACSSVGKQVDQVSSSLSAAKRHLSSRIDRVDSNIDECAQITAATRDEVSELRGDMKSVSTNVEYIHRTVQTLETKIDRINEKQNVTARGVRLLCGVVGTLEINGGGASIQESLPSSSRPALEHHQIFPTSRAFSLPPNVESMEPPSPSSSSNGTPKVLRFSKSSVSASGLKDLEEISNLMKASTSSETLSATGSAGGSRTTGSSSSGWFASLLSRTTSATTFK
ncbi:hypothetical protein Scep_018222 [Stephania cephalantha]|uniref:DUF1664 domain-containing protein n=1 Tax=Stephania cephalantha TaxID=152367 RepID=A0AAP0NVL7_9MAGN